MSQEILGVGVYSVPEASRLTGIPTSAIRRWLWGRRVSTNGHTRFVPPLWDPQLPKVEGERALGFRDLIEVRFVHAFLEHGLRMAEVRLLHHRAQELLEEPYPFSSLRFKRGRMRVAAEIGPRNGRQARIAEDFVDRLYEGLEFSRAGIPVRWWPLGRDHRVVVDPKRNFGHPIVSTEGVSVAVLADAFETEKSIPAVARWYEVGEAAVRDAVELQRRIAA